MDLVFLSDQKGKSLANIKYLGFKTLNQLRIVIYKALYFDVAQGRMNGAPNETQSVENSSAIETKVPFACSAIETKVPFLQI